MEHKNRYKYKGYEVSVFISHQGDLSVDIYRNGDLIYGCFGNTIQADQYIDDLDFETNKIAITGDGRTGYTNVRVTREVFNKILGECLLREVGGEVSKDKAYLLGNEVEHEILKSVTGIDFKQYYVDWFKVYYKE